MKYILSLLLLIISSACFSQTIPIFYFDKDMNVVPKSEAVISGTGEMSDGLYKVTCYYKKKHHLACIVHYTDATLGEHQGLYQYYHENGNIQTEGIYHNGERDGLWTNKFDDGKISDSMLFNNGMQVINSEFYYYPDNHLKLMAIDDIQNNKFYTTTYDEKGQVMAADSIDEDYTNVYLMPDTTVQFPGGSKAWTHYILTSLTKHVGDLGESDYGTVLIRFFTDTSGNISDVRAMTMKYSKLAQIMTDAIEKGPAWTPAQQNGKKVKTFRVQPVTLTNPDK